MGMFAAPEGVPEPALCWKFMVTLSPANSRAVLHAAKTSLGVQGRVLSSTAVSSLWSRVLSHCWSVNIFPELALLGPGDLVRSSWG